MDGRSWQDIAFFPKTTLQKVFSKTVFFLEPYYAYFFWPHIVNECREAGLKVGDLMGLHFNKEPYVQFHLYAQYFHPTTMIERVNHIHFYRQPNRLYKGTKVPDWAQNHVNEAGEFDLYTAQQWAEAMDDFTSEITPVPFFRDPMPLDANPLLWLQVFGLGAGKGRRLFYNEKPVHSIWHDGGEFDPEEMNYGYEPRLQNPFMTATEEGKEQFDKHMADLNRMYPESFPKEGYVYPHEVLRHFQIRDKWFQRNIQNVRELKLMQQAVEMQKAGTLTEEQSLAVIKFIRDGHFRDFYTVQDMAYNQKHYGVEGQPLWTGLHTLIEELQLYFLPQACTSQPDLEQFWEHADYFLGVHEMEADFNWWWEMQQGTSQIPLNANTPEQRRELLKKMNMPEDEIAKQLAEIEETEAAVAEARSEYEQIMKEMGEHDEPPALQSQ